MRWPCLPQRSEGSSERWLITYADMITLLLVLFIILYATANTDLQKFQALSEALSEGFGATAPNAGGTPSSSGGSEAGTSPIWDSSGGGTSPLTLFPENQTPISLFEFAQMLEGAGEQAGAGTQPGQGEAAGQGPEEGLLGELQGMMEEALAQAGREGLDVSGLGAGVRVTYDERGIRISFYPGDILFESGSARLRTEFREILKKLASPLARLRNRVEIQGHTDNLPINTAVFPSNWELSTGRAGAVIRYLEGQGLPSVRLQAAGYADTMPVAPNDTRQGRSLNRRVDILVLREEATTVMPQGPAGELSGVSTEPVTPDPVAPEPASSGLGAAAQTGVAEPSHTEEEGGDH